MFLRFLNLTGLKVVFDLQLEETRGILTLSGQMEDAQNRCMIVLRYIPVPTNTPPKIEQSRSIVLEPR